VSSLFLRIDFGRYRPGLKPGVLAAHGCASSITITAAMNGSGGADGKADRRPARRERAAERRHDDADETGARANPRSDQRLWRRLPNS